MATWTTEWTGRYPSLCSGEWHLYRDGVEVPNPFGECPAYTHGSYSCWYFDKYYCEQFDDYEDGSPCDAWIAEHRAWLETIAPECEFAAIYNAFNVNDFRSGSCGGCI